MRPHCIFPLRYFSMADKQSGMSGYLNERVLTGASGGKTKAAKAFKQSAQRAAALRSAPEGAAAAGVSAQGGSTQSSVLQPMDTGLAGGLAPRHALAQSSSAALGAMDEGQPGELGQSAHLLAPLPSSAAAGGLGLGAIEEEDLSALAAQGTSLAGGLASRTLSPLPSQPSSAAAGVQGLSANAGVLPSHTPLKALGGSAAEGSPMEVEGSSAPLAVQARGPPLAGGLAPCALPPLPSLLSSGGAQPVDVGSMQDSAPAPSLHSSAREEAPPSMQDSEQATPAPFMFSSAYRYSSADLAAVNRAALPESPALPATVEAAVVLAAVNHAAFPEGPVLPAAVEAAVAHQLEGVQVQLVLNGSLLAACVAGDLELVRELLGQALSQWWVQEEGAPVGRGGGGGGVATFSPLVPHCTPPFSHSLNHSHSATTFSTSLQLNKRNKSPTLLLLQPDNVTVHVIIRLGHLLLDFRPKTFFEKPKTLTTVSAPGSRARHPCAQPLPRPRIATTLCSYCAAIYRLGGPSPPRRRQAAGPGERFLPWRSPFMNIIL